MEKVVMNIYQETEYFEHHIRQLGWEKVIHCRECKYWYGKATAKDDETHICGILVDGNFDDTHTEANYYCGSGKRRKETE